MKKDRERERERERIKMILHILIERKTQKMR
jgi:hypothetical protein